MSTEADIWRKFVVPMLQAAGWDSDAPKFDEILRVVGDFEKRFNQS
jgi:hypothetical protein